MRKTNMKTVLLTLAALLTGSLAASSQTTVEQTRPLSPNGTVEIENLAGSVTVMGWDRNEVRVSGQLGRDVVGLEVDGDGDEVDIEVEVSNFKNKSRGGLESHIEVQVPRGANVSVETLSADVEVADFGGRLELESMSGNFRVAGEVQAAVLESVSGNIRLDGNRTRVDAESVSGDVTLSGVAESVDVETVSGNVDVGASSVRNASLTSVNGRIEFNGVLASDARLDVEAHSSNVVVTLPETTSATFDLGTFSGEITNDFGATAKSGQGFLPGRRLEFTLGSGDASVSVECFSGNIRLKKSG